MKRRKFLNLLYNQLSKELDFINFTTPFEQITANFITISAIEERFKKRIAEMLENQEYQTEITQEIKENFDLYLSKEWKYFGNERYYENNLEILFNAMNNYVFILSKIYYLKKQKLLNYQEELINAIK